MYVVVLLQYGRQHIEVAKKLQRNDSSDDEEPPVPDDKPPSAVYKENGINGTKMTVIEREEILGPSPELNYKRSTSQERNNLEFHLYHCMDLVKAGMESIIEDQMIFMLASTTLASMLPAGRIQRIIGKLSYLVSIRILVRSLSVVVNYHDKTNMPKSGIAVANHTTIIDVAVLSNNQCFSMKINYGISIMCFNFLSRCISAVITYHDVHNKPRGGICVANHTSPIDALVLMCDNCYSLIGQRHGGFLGLLQRALARASPHIWFERSEVKDRHAVARRSSPRTLASQHSVMQFKKGSFEVGPIYPVAIKSSQEHLHQQHLRNSVQERKLRIVWSYLPSRFQIFPKNTCINNTSVMQFKKGSFEVGGLIYPVAIK
ncbi:hypothetical protein MSG28_014777 [Choristoneura fumiferana]|uniref:Uncharacterized protein n=1 Tax=Choristoneura fumiferana TaxID=7141 RepID=A0ACC0JSP2_CHOFU|nr:hypothetical protein MSG28_014777 [Choristoneura fumiferana]